MGELVANTYRTTLVGAIDDSQDTLVVADAPDGLDADGGDQFRINIDGELMLVTGMDTSGPIVFTVTRAIEGPNPAATHDDGAAVTAVLTAGGLLQLISQSPRMPWLNVKDDGAIGDNSADDTDAINGVINALNNAGGGVLYFPFGTYLCSGALTTITVPCLVLGDGTDAFDGSSPISKLVCSADAVDFLTINAKRAVIRGLAVECSVATPTAGSGIMVSSSYLGARVDYEDAQVAGFYIDYDIQVGALWTMRGCVVRAPVLHGVRARNTVNGDAGDWTIDGNWFYAGLHDHATAIHQESSGGGKITNNKFNESGLPGDSTRFLNVIESDIAGASTILLIEGNSIENYDGDAIHARADMLTITGNEIGQYGNATGRAVYAHGSDQLIVDDNHFHSDSSPAVAVVVDDVTRAIIGINTNNGFTDLLSVTSGSVLDATGGVGDLVFISGVPSAGQVPVAVDAGSAVWDDPSGGSLPTGGTIHQVLTKLSGTDGDADWETPASGALPAGGTTDQFLSKASDTDYDAIWVDAIAPPSAILQFAVGVEATTLASDITDTDTTIPLTDALVLPPASDWTLQIEDELIHYGTSSEDPSVTFRANFDDGNARGCPGTLDAGSAHTGAFGMASSSIDNSSPITTGSGNTVHLSVWWKAASGTTGEIQLEGLIYSAVTGDGTWHHFVASAVESSGTRHLRIGGGSFHYDEVEVWIGAATDPPPVVPAITRGVDGTTAAAHVAGVPATYVLTGPELRTLMP